jgi:hypothetical protein
MFRNNERKEQEMPVVVRKRGDSYRIVEKATGRLAKTSKGNPRDGGGHNQRSQADAQARAINMNLHK